MVTIHAAHLAFPLLFFSVMLSAMVLYSFAGTIYKWSLPSFLKLPSHLTDPFPPKTETCPLSPLPMRNPPGCVYLQNLATSQVDSIKSEFERTLDSVSFKNKAVDDLKEQIVPRITKSFESVLKSLSGSGLRDSNFCLGTYDSSQQFSGFEGVCQELPLWPHKWSVFGFALSLDVSSPFLPLCTGFPSRYASFCIAVAKDCVGNPSIAFSFNPRLFKCQPFNSVISLPASGLSSLFVTLASELVEYATFGISFSNSFVHDFEMNTGREFVKVSIPGTIYTSGEFVIRPSDFFHGVPDFMKLRGQGKQILSADGKDGVEKTVDWINNNPLKLDKFPETLGGWEDKDYRLFFIMETITFDLLLSELKTESELPDLRGVELGKGCAYVSNAALTRSSPLLPGIYINANGISGDEVREMLTVLLTYMEKSVSSLGWLPLDLNPAQLLDIVDVESLKFELALAMVESKLSIMLYTPLLQAWLGIEKVSCVIDLVLGDIDCNREKGIQQAKLGIGASW